MSDLVLIDGCLDDITSEGVTAPEPLREGMAGPLAISFKDITMRLQFRQEIYEKCHDDMKILLQEVASKFSNPETRIVVTGYYQQVSDRTDFTNAGPIFYWATSGINPLDPPISQRQMVFNSRAMSNGFQQGYKNGSG